MPRRRRLRQTVMLEKPPAMKNRGMTCSSHVASCSAGIEVKALAPVMWPSRTTTVAISQWPSTTMSRLPARTASMNRSRSGAVAAATLSAKVAGGGRTCMSSCWPPGGSGLSGFAHPQQGQDLGHHHVLDLVGVDALVGSVDPREGEVFGAPEQDVGRRGRLLQGGDERDGPA